MLLDMPATTEWNQHFKERLEAAMDIGLVSSTVPHIPASTRVFVPNSITSEALTCIKPSEQLKVLLNKSVESGTTWASRDDLFDDAAAWLRESFRKTRGAWIYCEAGYSEGGDRSLSERPHIIVNGKPFLSSPIAGRSIPELATLMRWARGPRLLGAVWVSGLDLPRFEPLTRGYFICDAFDGDTVMLADFNGGS